MKPGSTALQALENITLPTLPSVMERLNALLEDPEVGTREVGAAVAQDAPLSARVLRIANSAAYGLRERVLSAEHASAVLGMRELRSIALAASVMGQFEHLEAGAFDLNHLWKHAILVAQTARALGKASDAVCELSPDELYTVGLVHDLGQVVLLEHFSDAFLEAVQRSKDEGRTLDEVELEMLGFTHAEVGARIALRWNLPPALVSAVQYHHGPAEEIEAEPVVALVDLANRLAERAAEGDREGALATLDDERAELLEISNSDFEKVVETALESWGTIEV